MLLFSIFHVFFSHQNVQMNAGPHEKKWCGKFFWEPFLNKFELLIGGKPGYRVQEIQKKLHQCS